MKTIAVRLHGKNDLRLEEFDLPGIRDDEILADITSNSICMSCHKAALQGAEHKRIPKDVAENPIILGHEFCGTILKVGKTWQGKYAEGQKYGIQPALNYPGRELEAPGYSFRYIGGNATKIIIPREIMEMDCLLPYSGETYFSASLAEPVSCIIGAFNSEYHFKAGDYTHQMGIVAGGTMAILAGAGPMGFGAIDYALHGPRKPRLLVVTDVDDARLTRVALIYTIEEARRCGVELVYLNTGTGDPIQRLKDRSGGQGYDDVFVFAPVAALIEQASRILGYNGCLNFFAGPSKADFFAPINFYDVHYMGHHVAGSSGGNTADMRDAMRLMGEGKLNPAAMITHVGGMDCVPDAVLRLPSIPGGKKLVYTHISMPLTAIADFAALGSRDPLFANLAVIAGRHKGLWSAEAEKYLLAQAKPIQAPRLVA